MADVPAKPSSDQQENTSSVPGDTTTEALNYLLAGLQGLLKPRGTWNANTNDPTLGDNGAGGEPGDFFIVGTAGSTSLDGTSDWQVNDWAVNMDPGTGKKWYKVDNSDIVGSTTFLALTDTPGSYGGAGKFVKVNPGNDALIFADAPTDPTAIHDDVANEITAVTEKATPVSADVVLIEQASDGVKYKAQLGNLPGGGGGSYSPTHIAGIPFGALMDTGLGMSGTDGRCNIEFTYSGKTIRAIAKRMASGDIYVAFEQKNSSGVVEKQGTIGVTGGTGRNRPIISNDGSGRIWCIVQNGTNIEVWYSGIGDYTTWTKVGTDPYTGTGGIWDAAINANGTLIVVYNAGSNYYCKYLDTTNIGGGWSSQIQIGDSLYVAAWGICVEGGPSDEFDVYMGGQASYYGAGYDFYHQRTTNGGATWLGSNELVFTTTSGAFQGKASAVRLSDGSLYVTVYASGMTERMVYKKPSGGSWTKVQGYGTGNKVVFGINEDGTEENVMVYATLVITQDGSIVLITSPDTSTRPEMGFGFMTIDGAGKVGMAEKIVHTDLNGQNGGGRWHYSLQTAQTCDRFPDCMIIVTNTGEGTVVRYEPRIYKGV